MSDNHLYEEANAVLSATFSQHYGAGSSFLAEEILSLSNVISEDYAKSSPDNTAIKEQYQLMKKNTMQELRIGSPISADLSYSDETFDHLDTLNFENYTDHVSSSRNINESKNEDEKCEQLLSAVSETYNDIKRKKQYISPTKSILDSKDTNNFTISGLFLEKSFINNESVMDSASKKTQEENCMLEATHSPRCEPIISSQNYVNHTMCDQNLEESNLANDDTTPAVIYCLNSNFESRTELEKQRNFCQNNLDFSDITDTDNDMVDSDDDALSTPSSLSDNSSFLSPSLSLETTKEKEADSSDCLSEAMMQNLSTDTALENSKFNLNDVDEKSAISQKAIDIEDKLYPEVPSFLLLKWQEQGSPKNTTRFREMVNTTNEKQKESTVFEKTYETFDNSETSKTLLRQSSDSVNSPIGNITPKKTATITDILRQYRIKKSRIICNDATSTEQVPSSPSRSTRGFQKSQKPETFNEDPDVIKTGKILNCNYESCGKVNETTINTSNISVPTVIKTSNTRRRRHNSINNTRRTKTKHDLKLNSEEAKSMKPSIEQVPFLDKNKNKLLDKNKYEKHHEHKSTKISKNNQSTNNCNVSNNFEVSKNLNVPTTKSADLTSEQYKGKNLVKNSTRKHKNNKYDEKPVTNRNNIIKSKEKSPVLEYEANIVLQAIKRGEKSLERRLKRKNVDIVRESNKTLLKERIEKEEKIVTLNSEKEKRLHNVTKVNNYNDNHDHEEALCLKGKHLLNNQEQKDYEISEHVEVTKTNKSQRNKNNFDGENTDTIQKTNILHSDHYQENWIPLQWRRNSMSPQPTQIQTELKESSANNEKEFKSKHRGNRNYRPKNMSNRLTIPKPVKRNISPNREINEKTDDASIEKDNQYHMSLPKRVKQSNHEGEIKVTNKKTPKQRTPKRRSLLLCQNNDNDSEEEIKDVNLQIAEENAKLYPSKLCEMIGRNMIRLPSKLTNARHHVMDIIASTFICDYSKIMFENISNADVEECLEQAAHAMGCKSPSLDNMKRKRRITRYLKKLSKAA